MFPRYQSVQSGLTQPKSELQDARTLTESLERVELEENQERCREERLDQVSSQTWFRVSSGGSSEETLDQSFNSHLYSNQQPHRSETSSAEVGARSGGDVPLAEIAGNPAESLQEAGEAPSHTEKSHFQKHEEAVEALLSKV